MMKISLLLLWIMLFSGCGIFDNNTGDEVPAKLYIALQGVDQVAVLNGENLETIKSIDTNYNGNSLNNTPHFIAIDGTGGYWFVSTIMSGYIGMYDLDTDVLIDTLFLGDSPALMSVDEVNSILYCSRMMPMAGMAMGSVSQVVQKINYAGGHLEPVAEYQIGSPSPHGISYDRVSGWVITASNTADWLYRIDNLTGEVTGAILDVNAWAPPDIEIQRLKPIQCAVVRPQRVVVTCSAGKWMNPYTGSETEIAGNLQLWDTEAMTQLDTLNFQWYSKPWHSVFSPETGDIYIVLSGDQSISNSAGVASVAVNDDQLNLNWISHNSGFRTLHGIDISADGTRLYVTSRSTGEIFTLDAVSGNLISSAPLTDQPDMVLAGGVAAVK